MVFHIPKDSLSTFSQQDLYASKTELYLIPDDLKER